MAKKIRLSHFDMKMYRVLRAASKHLRAEILAKLEVLEKEVQRYTLENAYCYATSEEPLPATTLLAHIHSLEERLDHNNELIEILDERGTAKYIGTRDPHAMCAGCNHARSHHTHLPSGDECFCPCHGFVEKT